MAYEHGVGLDIGTLTAAGDYSSATNQYRVVRQNTGTQFTRGSSAAGTRVTGILQDTPSSGEHGLIRVLGISKFRVLSTALTAMTVGAKLGGSTNGGLIRSTAVGRYTLGRTMTSFSSASTGVYTMLITHEGGGSSGAGQTP